LFLAVAPPALAAPSVVSESASQITASDATLEATIATQPAEHVLTQFQLATSPSELSPEFQCPRELAPSGGPEGKGGSSLCLELHGVTPFPIQGAEPPGEIVRLNLARIVTLIPSTTYYYRTLAAKEHFPFGDVWVVEPPVVYAATQSFTTISSSPPTVAHVEPRPSARRHNADDHGHRLRGSDCGLVRSQPRHKLHRELGDFGNRRLTEGKTHGGHHGDHTVGNQLVKR
jgi:hypothetical protein